MPACLSSGRDCGFTLFELLIAVSVLIILLGLGLPSFNGMIQKMRAKAISTDIFTAIQLARSEAVTRGTDDVVLCGTLDGQTCVSIWRDQLLIFKDTNKNNVSDTGELIRTIDVTQPNGWVQTKTGINQKAVKYKSTGGVSFTGSFIICTPDNLEHSRQITFNQPGRPYVTKMKHKGQTLITKYGGKVLCEHL